MILRYISKTLLIILFLCLAISSVQAQAGFTRKQHIEKVSETADTICLSVTRSGKIVCFAKNDTVNNGVKRFSDFNGLGGSLIQNTTIKNDTFHFVMKNNLSSLEIGNNIFNLGGKIGVPSIKLEGAGFKYYPVQNDSLQWFFNKVSDDTPVAGAKLAANGYINLITGQETFFEAQKRFARVFAGQDNEDDIYQGIGLEANDITNKISIFYGHWTNPTPAIEVTDTGNIYIKSLEVHNSNIEENEVLTAIDVNGEVEFRPPLIKTWTTGTRPGTPYNNQFGFNSTINKMEFWNGSSWQAIN